MQNGIEVFKTLSSVRLDELGRVGVVANQTSLDRFGRSSVDVIHEVLKERSIKSEVVGVFGPQHGFYQTEQDNMIETPDQFFTLSDGKIVPLWSLYSKSRQPTSEQISHVDTIVVDLQDVGCRVYTYMLTLAGCLRSLKGTRKKILVLDRPNPIGLSYYSVDQKRWLRVEGECLDLRFHSFVGWYAIPLRHGLTLGELALFMEKAEDMKDVVEVVKVTGLERKTPLSVLRSSQFHMPSPNIPTWDSAFFFPSFVSLEGTNLSEGRGTTLPFQLVGAPHLPVQNWSVFFFDFMEKIKATNFYFDPEVIKFSKHSFRPTFNKHAGEICSGLRFFSESYEPISHLILCVSFLCFAKLSLNERFSWKNPGYEYNYKDLPIHLIMGSEKMHQLVENWAALSTDNQARCLLGFLEESDSASQAFCEENKSQFLYV